MTDCMIIPLNYMTKDESTSNNNENKIPNTSDSGNENSHLENLLSHNFITSHK